MRSASATTALDRLMMGTVCCASVAFCAFAVVTSVNDPEYFSRKLISSLQRGDLDPITTGAVVKKDAAEASLPVPEIVRAKSLEPSDYQIVMVFEDEAILATDDELMRVKVGSVLPGLGIVKKIVPEGTGGTISAENATLRSATAP